MYYSNTQKQFQPKTFKTFPQFSEDFSNHQFVMFAVAECEQTWKARLVFCYLVNKPGATLREIESATGLDRQWGVKTAIKELETTELVTERQHTWFATKDTLGPGKGFAKVYCPLPGCPLTALDNLVLWKLVDLARNPHFKFNNRRHTVLGNMIGADKRSVRRSTERLVELNLIRSNWEVNLGAIEATWFVSETKKLHIHGTDQLAETLAPDNPVSIRLPTCVTVDDSPEDIDPKVMERRVKRMDKFCADLVHEGIAPETVTRLRDHFLLDQADHHIYKLLHLVRNSADKSYDALLPHVRQVYRPLDDVI